MSKIYNKALDIKLRIELKIGINITWETCLPYICKRLNIDKNNLVNAIYEIDKNITTEKATEVIIFSQKYILRIINMNNVEILGNSLEWETISVKFLKEKMNTSW